MTDKYTTYIGDGVYASYDGYHIWLKTQDGMAIALEPQVQSALFSYIVSIHKKHDDEPNENS